MFRSLVRAAPLLFAGYKFLQRRRARSTEAGGAPAAGQSR
jgi:hypothetical protein